MAGTVETLVGQFKQAVSDIVIADEANGQDVYLALKQLTREWVMPEKTHATPPSGGTGGPPNGGTATITSVAPSSTAVGAATDITITGTGFTESSQVKADGNALASTYVSATELGSFVPGPLAPGSIELTVDDSNPFTFTATAARRARE